MNRWNRCPGCGITTSRVASYCPECGESWVIECINCGKTWRFWELHKFCPSCGKPVIRQGVTQRKSSNAGTIIGKPKVRD